MNFAFLYYSGYGYGYFDWTYLLIVLPIFVLTLIAQIRVKTVHNKYNSVYSRRGLTAAQAAREILDANGLNYVEVERIQGQLTDHYDPQTNVIRLSESVYASTSVAALGVAAHEAGHAVQYGEGYAPIKLRSALIPITNIGATISWPLLLVGYFLQWTWLIIAGIALYGLAALFQFVTLPVEFNASRRAMTVLAQSNMLDSDELSGAKKVLTAAAMTYVAALAASLANLLRLVILFGRKRQ